MSLLVVGNSHIVGLRDALHERGEAVYVPVPLCPGFETAIQDGSGRFRISAGWKNMRSPIGAQEQEVHFDFARRERRLVVVGMKVFGCFPLFLPLIAQSQPRRFLICLEGSAAKVPVNERYQLVSESCLRQAFADQLAALIDAHSWMAERFDSTRWIPSPPPPAAFGHARFLPQHRWFIRSGLFRTTVRLFNEAIASVNESPAAQRLDFRFLQHPLEALDTRTGFLSNALAHDPARAADIHATASYYETYVAALTA